MLKHSISATAKGNPPMTSEQVQLTFNQDQPCVQVFPAACPKMAHRRILRTSSRLENWIVVARRNWVNEKLANISTNHQKMSISSPSAVATAAATDPTTAGTGSSAAQILPRSARAATAAATVVIGELARVLHGSVRNRISSSSSQAGPSLERHFFG